MRAPGVRLSYAVVTPNRNGVFHGREVAVLNATGLYLYIYIYYIDISIFLYDYVHILLPPIEMVFFMEEKWLF